MAAGKTSVEVRSGMVEALELDLVGPSNDHAFAAELLPEPPHRWYLTGFLVPTNAPEDQRIDPQSTEEVGGGSDDANGVDDGTPPDAAAARQTMLPSSIGLSFLLPVDVDEVEVTVEWGDFEFEGKGDDDDPGDIEEGHKDGPPEEVGDEEENEAKPAWKPKRSWRRKPRTETLLLKLPSLSEKKSEATVPNSRGLHFYVITRPIGDGVADTGRIPRGTKSVTLFLVNYREPAVDRRLAYKTFVYQVRLQVQCASGFVARPDLRGAIEAGETHGEARLADDWDYRLGDLQYRDVMEYAVGHATSARHEVDQDGACRRISSTWIPRAEVERVSPAKIDGVTLDMEVLGALGDGAEAEQKLIALVAQYRDWIMLQEQESKKLTPERQRTATDLRLDAETTAARIEKGIKLLADEKVLDAFRIMNRAMAAQARQRFGVLTAKAPSAVDPPQWRPFQLAFILMALRGIVEPEHSDRESVDLLFFPTGGGKTEAYLGLAAFTMVLRRLRNPGISSAGVTVLMRYTLRLLTLDQLGRASALMCALELEREKNVEKLGKWPFEIGLWVGQAATPNRMGCKGYDGPGKDHTAYTKVMRFLRDDKSHPSPIPIESCPWCGAKFTPGSFRLEPNRDNPLNLRVHCSGVECDFNGGERDLPIVAVDEPIYRRLPAFIIATVDKFASLPWIGEVGGLFGLVDRYDDKGFYGPTKPGQGVPLPGGRLLPPDLIVQDELHLISGPLGTIAGLYEAAIDELSTVQKVGKRIRPKIVASTATVRKAQSQIQALFERKSVVVFPTPGVDRRDSYFAKTDTTDVSPARLYLGVAAQGRSPKSILLRVALAMLSSGNSAYLTEGGRRNNRNPADPYMTLLGYFNSLRELGGSRRIMEDEVRTRLAEYGRRRRVEPEDKLFKSRQISYEVRELTSREPTNKVAETKDLLSKAFHEDKRVDVALATNMISVGLDISRLGLMVVFGQPKTTSEYIQATSRVGRERDKPGLVITILNTHKPRDRSHYERFTLYHETFYRGVEATSVTPFSPRALDRALPSVLVGLSRHIHKDMTAPLGATEILTLRSALESIRQRLAERARDHRSFDVGTESQDAYDQVASRCHNLLETWLKLALAFQSQGFPIQYQVELPGKGTRLLYEYLHPKVKDLTKDQLKFRSNRSMRDVEANVDLRVRQLNEWGAGS